MAKINIPRNMFPLSESYRDDLDEDDVYNILVGYVWRDILGLKEDGYIYEYAFTLLSEPPYDSVVSNNFVRDYPEYSEITDDNEQDYFDELSDYTLDSACSLVDNYTQSGLYTLPRDVVSEMFSGSELRNIVKYFDNIKDDVTVEDVINYVEQNYNMDKVEGVAESIVDEYAKEWYGK